MNKKILISHVRGGYFRLHPDNCPPNPVEDYADFCRLIQDDGVRGYISPDPHQNSYDIELINILNFYYPEGDFTALVQDYELYNLALKLLAKNCVVFSWEHEYYGGITYCEVSGDSGHMPLSRNFACVTPSAIDSDHITREQQRSMLLGALEEYSEWARGDIFYIEYTSAGGHTDTLGGAYGSYSIEEMISYYFSDNIKFDELNDLILI